MGWLSVTTFVGCAMGMAFPAEAQLSKFGEPGCEKCKPGEYRERVRDVIPSGDEIHGVTDPPYGDRISVAQTVGNAVVTGAKTIAGVADPKSIAGSLGDVSNRLGLGGTVGSLLGQYGHQYARCKAVCVVVPQNATVVATSYQINTLFPDSAPPGSMHEVNPLDKDHGLTDYAHVYPPESSPGAVCSVISNWAGGFQRTVIMDAYFTSPSLPIEVR